uniref:Uncharacterized protein n=1 Tax=Tanacetum cinerariifolium TaxID=118510 RepID=A0A699H623_TANCI|nr:hypothetical protein [Tanacetum cinerariifolium]
MNPASPEGTTPRSHLVSHPHLLQLSSPKARLLNHQGFAAALAVLVTGASQSKQHGKLKTAGTPVNTVRPIYSADSKTIVNCSRPISNVHKRGHSQVIRPFNKYSAYKTSIFNKQVNNVRVKDSIAREGAVVSGNIGKEVNAVKASACWVWKSKHSSASNTFKKYSYIDAQGNKCYLTEYEDYDVGFVSFGDGKVEFLAKAKAVNTACYVLNRALVTNPQNNKFDGKANEGYFVGYSVVSKAMKVFNKRNKIVEETLNIRFLENAPNVKGNGPDWIFDIDSLTVSMNYVPVITGNQTNGIARTRDNLVAGQDEKKKELAQEYILIPICITDPLISQDPNNSTADNGKKATEVDKSRVSDNGGQDDQVTRSEFERLLQQERQTEHLNNTNSFNTISSPVSTDGPSFVNAASPSPINGAATPASIGTKWVFRNKKDERGIVVKNKARLFTQRHTQEEGIDYDEVFAPVARIEAIRLFMAYASFKDFVVYQMDVKSAFLYRKIEEEVYVCQPPGFEDSYFLDKVYKVEKGLYRLHQTPRAWYETLLTYLMDTRFHKVSTPIEPNKTLIKDEEAEDVDVYMYRSMIGSLTYLTASRLDITFAMYACARFQITPKTLHLHVVKRIFRYLKGQPNLGLWYPKDSPFDLEAFSDSDYAGASLDRKSTKGGCQFLCKRLISWQYKKQTIVSNSTTEAEYVAAANCCGQNLVFHSKTKHIEIRHHFIRDSYEKKLIQVIKIYTDNNVVDLCTKAFDFSRKLVQVINPCAKKPHWVADTQTRFETASKKSRDPPLLKVNTFGSGEDRMEHPDDLTDFVPPKPYDLPISGDHTPGSDEGRPKLLELMNICTQLSNRVLAFEEAKTTQDKVITRLKLRVKRLEKKIKARTLQPMKRRLFKGRVETSTNNSLGEDESKQERNNDKTEELNLTDGADREVIIEDKGSCEKGGSTADQVSTARPEVSIASVSVNVSAATPSTPHTTTTTIFGDEDLTIAQTLIKLRSEKAKVKGVAFRDVEEPLRLTRLTTTLPHLPTIDPKDKAQRIYEEEFAKFDRAEMEKQKQEEATIAALTEEFDEIQARIDADHELAIRMTHEKQEKYTIEESARLLAEYVKRRMKQLAAERATAIRNKPPTRTQVRNMMITYLKHMGKKGKRIKRVADSAFKQKSSKKQKMMQEQEYAKSDEEAAADYEHEKKELRMWLTIIPDEKKTVDPEILSTKYPIVDLESQNLGNVNMEGLHVYKIIKANRNTSYYKSPSMMRKINRQELVDLHRLVMKRFKGNTLKGYNLLLWGDLKVMFEPNAEDEIWSNQQDWNLIKKRYPLIKEMLEKMLNWKLEVEAESTMKFELLKSQMNIKFRGGWLGIEDLFNLILLMMVSVADEDM